MKYTGRIIVSSIVIVTSAWWLFIYYKEYGVFHWEEIYYNLPVLVLSYYLGRRHDQAAFYANYDILTHVHNRHYLTKAFPKILKKTRNNSGDMTVFIIDVDNFKVINDTYGHQKGDEVLVLIASIIKDDIRDTDIIGRLGGDEFFVGIQNLKANTEHQIMQRWKESLSDIQEKMGIPVTISIGVASFPRDGKNFEELYHNADLRMYEDKRKTKQTLAHT